MSEFSFLLGWGRPLTRRLTFLRGWGRTSQEEGAQSPVLVGRGYGDPPAALVPRVVSGGDGDSAASTPPPSSAERSGRPGGRTAHSSPPRTRDRALFSFSQPPSKQRPRRRPGTPPRSPAGTAPVGKARVQPDERGALLPRAGPLLPPSLPVPSHLPVRSWPVPATPPCRPGRGRQRAGPPSSRPAASGGVGRLRRAGLGELRGRPEERRPPHGRRGDRGYLSF